MISDLINYLEEVVNEHGDMYVTNKDTEHLNPKDIFDVKYMEDNKDYILVF